MLYVIGTPIGNLEDLSYRQAKILANSEIILTEDTRSTGQLLIRIREYFNFDIRTDQRLISYYKDTEFEKLPEVISLLEQNKEVSLISQAGMPVISDPGYLLIRTVIQKDISYTVIPGPSAVTTALLHSGYKNDQWMFVGFLPKKEGEIKTVFKKLKSVTEILKHTVFVAFESPNRLHKTLDILSKEYPEMNITVTRELTKKFEEVARGHADILKSRDYKGEITIVFSFN